VEGDADPRLALRRRQPDRARRGAPCHVARLRLERRAGARLAADRTSLRRAHLLHRLRGRGARRALAGPAGSARGAQGARPPPARRRGAVLDAAPYRPADRLRSGADARLALARADAPRRDAALRPVRRQLRVRLHEAGLTPRWPDVHTAAGVVRILVAAVW